MSEEERRVYDLTWDILDQVEERMGLPVDWVDFVMEIARGAAYEVASLEQLVKGEPTGE